MIEEFKIFNDCVLELFFVKHLAWMMTDFRLKALLGRWVFCYLFHLKFRVMLSPEDLGMVFCRLTALPFSNFIAES